MKPCEPSSRSVVRGPFLRASVLALLLIVSASCGAQASVVVTAVRTWTAPDHTRVVLDLSGPAAYEARRVSGPERIAVNVTGGRFAATDVVDVGDPVLMRVRRNELTGRAQAVLDLRGDFRWRHFSLRAANGRPDRIVIDVFRSATGAGVEVPDTSAETSTTTEPAQDDVFTVVIDPGHGGMDPGAIRGGVREKDVVLDIAVEMERLIEAREGYQAVLTRDGDYFVRLADRVSRAKEADGDLFVSVHANANDRSSLQGMEVYFLSRGRAEDREAQELADRENAADMVGLAPEEHDDDSVLEILMDLRSSQVLTSSSRLANQILGAARRHEGLEARAVKQEVFRVLQSLAMPSSLVEVAYLTNDADRALLSTLSGRRRIATVLAEGVFAYRGETDPSLWRDGNEWTTLYRVRSGDTLWMLARRHDTTVAAIRNRNDLGSDVLSVGQQLTLP